MSGQTCTNLLKKNWKIISTIHQTKDQLEWFKIYQRRSNQSKVKSVSYKSISSKIRRLLKSLQILLMKKFKISRMKLKRKLHNINYCSMIRVLCSKRCILMLYLWSIETSKSLRMRRKLCNWNMRSILTF